MQNIKISPAFAMAILLVIFASLGTVLWMSSYLGSRPSSKALEGALPQKEEKKDTQARDLTEADDLGSLSPHGIKPVDESGDWKTYVNDEFHYTFKYPSDCKVSIINQGTKFYFLDVTGPVVDGEPWPSIMIDHYPDAKNKFYHPPSGVAVADWVTKNKDFPMSYDAIGPEFKVAGLPTVHLTDNPHPGVYGQDDYYFIRNGQLFRIKFLHTLNKRDWDLYNSFLAHFQFTNDPEALATGKNPAYLKNVYEKDGQRFIEADYIQWFTGKEALKAIIEDGQCLSDVKDKAQLTKEVDLCYPNCSDKFALCLPDGYHIRNVNPKLRTLELSSDAVITKTMVFESVGDEPEEITFAELKNNLDNDTMHFRDLPFWITSENNLVKKLDQQYLP